MKEKRKSIKSDLKRLDSMSDRDIDYSDNPATDENFWSGAEVFIAGKKAISIRVDEDVLNYFKAQGKGYQTIINRVLRRYMETHQTMTETKPKSGTQKG